MTGCACGAVFAQYDPRILLAGFTVQGKNAPVECSKALALATYLAFGIFCFIPVILDMAEARSLDRSRRIIGQDIGVTYRQIYEEIERKGYKNEYNRSKRFQLFLSGSEKRGIGPCFHGN